MNVFTKHDRENIRDSACFVFACNAWAVSVQGESKARKATRNTVDRTVSKSLDVMESTKPPQSRSEAIRRVVGPLAMMLAMVFPQYALAIRVAGWVWDYLHLETGATR